MQEMHIWSLAWEDPLKKGMPTQSSILAWRIPWKEEHSRLQSKGSQRVGHDWAHTHTYNHSNIIHKSQKVKTNVHRLMINRMWHMHKTECSVQFSSVTQSNSSQPHGPYHHRPPCPSPTPRVYSNSCPLSRWCHPTILSSVVPFSSCPQSFPASGSFQMSQLFASGGQRYLTHQRHIMRHSR